MENQNNNQMKDNSSKQILLSVLGVAILVVAVVGVSFAAFTYTGEGTEENTISTGTLSMTYTETTNGISISNAQPTEDEAGKKLSSDNEKFDFTVSAEINGEAEIPYEIAAIKQVIPEPMVALQNKDVKLYLEKSEDGIDYTSAKEPTAFTPSGSTTEAGTPVGAMVLYKGTFQQSDEEYFRLRMWVDHEATLDPTNLQAFTVKVNVYGKAQAKAG